MNTKQLGQLALTSILGLTLSYTFVFLAALPIRHMRLAFGRTTFLLTSLFCSAALLASQMWHWAAVYIGITVLIGIYRELEIKRLSVFTAAAISVTATATAGLSAIWAFTQLQGMKLQSFLIDKAEPFMVQLKELPRFKDADSTIVIWFLPSAMLITLMVILFVSLTLSRDMRRNQIQLRLFTLPDWAIWVFIGSLAFAFIPTGSPLLNVLGMNTLTVILAAYFFQGLAVFTYFLDRLRLYGFWRMLAYFLAFFQLFLFISGLGILDFWFDFRLQPLKKELN